MVRTSSAERKRRANQSEAKKLEEKLKSKNGIKTLRLNRRGDNTKKEAEARKIRMRKIKEKRKLVFHKSAAKYICDIPYSSPQTLRKAVRKIKKELLVREKVVEENSF
ncbi:hypothetical protein AVEN_251918-1 [Araneus ventricosus]|uniref:Uncharacterized protein n=1 Tax=Araneus ventricosus TaxID=182803 RepID=A0A4Y2H0G0_ARAVE|nr:hypothetical protein AVEN_251918-1 [Araneus ventricosus]